MAVRPIRVLALVTDAFGAYGGIAQYNRDFLSQLAAVDIVSDVHVLPRIWDGTAPKSDASIRLYAPSMHKFAYAARAAWLALKLKPDLIYCGHLYHGPLALRLAKLCGARLMSQLHGTEVWEPLSQALLRPLEQSDKVLCVSRDTKARYERQSINAPDNAHVLHNTVGPEFVPGDRSEARKQFGVADEYVLLSVSRLDARNGGYKGHEKVIDALPDLLVQRPDALYLIGGVGDDYERLAALVETRNLNAHVRFFGKVSAEHLPALYRAADLFVLPSTGEGFGIVYLEAMASGTLAIGINAGGAPDALRHGHLGICVEPEDFKSALLDAAMRNPTDRARLSRDTIEEFGARSFQKGVHLSMHDLLGSERVR